MFCKSFKQKIVFNDPIKIFNTATDTNLVIAIKEIIFLRKEILLISGACDVKKKYSVSIKRSKVNTKIVQFWSYNLLKIKTF